MSVVAALLSAFMLAVALPNEVAPYGVPIVGFFCLAPYFAALGRTSSRKEAAIAGAAFGIASHALSSYWLFFFEDYAIWTIGATSVAYGFLHALVAPILRELSRRFVGRSGIAGARDDGPDILRPFILAAAWTVWEWQKSIGFLGYPWGLVAYAVNDVPVLTQIADATGVYGLSFFLALSNGVVAELARARPPRKTDMLPVLRPALVTFSILVWFVAYGAWHLERPTPVVDTVPMVLVQHNDDSWASGGEIKALRRLIDLTRAGLSDLRGGKAINAGGKPIDKPALIAWPETALSRPFADYRPFYRKNPKNDPMIPFLEEIDIPLLTGAPVMLNWETRDATNSALLLQSDASIAYSYAKRHPVPFAEAVPFLEFKWVRDFMDAIGVGNGWTMGTEATVMEVPTASGRPLRFGVPICFEDAFPDVCADFFRNGADLLINITNDSWSRMVSSETQHYTVSRFRAIENRRVLVRATNGGVTAIVDAEGRTFTSLPLFTEAALAVVVPIQMSATPTTYFLLGDWLPIVLAASLLVLIAFRAAATYRTVRDLQSQD